MAKLAQKWFDGITTRHPYAVPVMFLLIGLGCLGFGAGLAVEAAGLWMAGGEPASAESGSGEAAASRQPGSAAAPGAGSGDATGLAAGAGGAASPERVRTRRVFALLTGSASLAAFGAMSIAIGANWMRLLKLEKLKDMVRPPSRLN